MVPRPRAPQLEIPLQSRPSSNSACRRSVLLGPLLDPPSSIGSILRYRYRKCLHVVEARRGVADLYGVMILFLKVQHEPAFCNQRVLEKKIALIPSAPDTSILGLDSESGH